MTGIPLSRLRDALLDDDIRSAFLCTYGLDCPFFEAEVLPALLPTRLATDARSGSVSAYLHEADQTAGEFPIDVLYDHLVGDGPQLFVGYRRVDLGNRAFHPKLIVAEYADRLRVVVTSANLTRPGWTSLFEIFVVDDLVAGSPHPWAAGLRTFIERADAAAGGDGRAAVRILRRLSEVGETPESELHHSYDGALVDAAFPVGAASIVHVVSPFFEGDEGRGLFDELRARYPDATLRLYLAANETADGFTVHGPPEKLDELRERGAELRLIQPLWEGDQDAPARRALHGKLLAVGDDASCRVTVGSANATRAALLADVGSGGNVELVVTTARTTKELRSMLPPSFAADDRLTFTDADPSGEELDAPNAASWVIAATYGARSRILHLDLKPDAPPLVVRYGPTEIGTTSGSSWNTTLSDIGVHAHVTVDAGAGPAFVPFTISDPEYMLPRGSPADLGLDGLADLLAGRRQLIHPPGDALPSHRQSQGEAGDSGTVGNGAIPWRRILAGLAGLRDDLARQSFLPDAIRWTLENPLRLGGLREAFRLAHESGRFLDGDLAFALHETARHLDGALETADELSDGAALIATTRDQVRADLGALLDQASPAIRQQLEILQKAGA